MYIIYDILIDKDCFKVISEYWTLQECIQDRCNLAVEAF